MGSEIRSDTRVNVGCVRVSVEGRQENYTGVLWKKAWNPKARSGLALVCVEETTGLMTVFYGNYKIKNTAT